MEGNAREQPGFQIDDFERHVAAEARQVSEVGGEDDADHCG